MEIIGKKLRLQWLEVVQSSSHLYQWLPGVREHEVVVGQAVTHWVVRTHHVEEGGEERKGVSVM